jgi:hypothetical protein
MHGPKHADGKRRISADCQKPWTLTDGEILFMVHRDLSLPRTVRALSARPPAAAEWGAAVVRLANDWSAADGKAQTALGSARFGGARRDARAPARSGAARNRRAHSDAGCRDPCVSVGRKAA